MMRTKIFFFCLLFLSTASWAQEVQDQKIKSDFNLNDYSSINLEVVEKEEDLLEDGKDKKKKKRKKNVYFGIKTRKAFTKQGYGNKLVFELFNTLKTPPEKVDTYVQEIYWLDVKEREIKNSKKIDPKYGRLLHGPYKKIQNDETLETGFFYHGKKHGRWMTWDKKGTLTQKQFFYKGWLRDAMVSYYDENKTQLKEVIPVTYGEIEGTYYHFYKDGKIAVKGKFDENKRTGLWVEYFPAKRKRKRVIQYDRDPYSLTKPFIAKEWNEKGKVVYRSPKLKKRRKR